MARLFDDASNEYIEVSATPVSDEPLTLACWFRTNDTSGNQNFVSIAHSLGIKGFYRMLFVSTNTLRAQKQDDSAGTTWQSDITGVSVDTWHHGAAVFTSNTSRTIYLDGSAGTTNTNSVTSPTLGYVTIGVLHTSGQIVQYTSGDIAEVGIWNVALTAAEIGALANGVRPIMVRPNALVTYVPLVRDDDEDLIGGLSFSASGTPTVSAHPRVFYPGVWQVGVPPAGATYSLALDAGAYTLTGQAATLTASRKLALNAGSYTLSGQDATLAANRALALDAGSYTVTGQDPSLTVGRALALDAGSYTLTGQDPSLTASRKLSLDAGSYTLTGNPATLNYSGEVLGSIVELTDSAAYAVVVVDGAAFVVALTDSTL